MREEAEIRAMKDRYAVLLAEAKAERTAALEANDREAFHELDGVVTEYMYVYNTLNWVLGQGWGSPA